MSSPSPSDAQRPTEQHGAHTLRAAADGPPRPLTGVRIIDLGGIGPGPFASMVLADLGAELIRVHRPQEAAQGTTGTGMSPVNPVLDRGKRSVVLDLKSAQGVAAARRLVATADAVIEGFRPGVAERMGLGPADLMGENPQLVYGRITGWGQTGPDSHRAGHDMNYIAGSGVLSQLGRAGEAPQFPTNLVADFGGGGMQLALGIVAALLRAKTGGPGAVVDATMGDGANLLWSMQFGMEAQGVWKEGRGTNMLDSGAPFYDVYRTSDDQYVSVGCIEPQFYAEFVEKLGLADALGGLQPGHHLKRENWDLQRTVYTEAIASRTQAEIDELFAGSDACTIGIRSFEQAEADPHNTARELFFRDEAGIRHPAPAPRFADLGGATWAGGQQTAAEVGAGSAGSAPAAGAAEGPASGSATAVRGGGEPYVQPGAAPQVGADTDELLASAGLSADEITALREAGAAV
ncbi:MAG TPA: CoA transferase [Brevibacterium senegalense]|uniref:CoA transferase n=1 Tax=Brevibacterium senegalense TaxID=1033736 RepID=A0A921MG09_9MICO|nr:CoA transferase [Brevibacterium senegalense]